MEGNQRIKSEKAILAGLDADVFSKTETATEQTMDELEALLETAGGVCVGKVAAKPSHPGSPLFFRRRKGGRTAAGCGGYRCRYGDI